MRHNLRTAQPAYIIIQPYLPRFFFNSSILHGCGDHGFSEPNENTDQVSLDIGTRINVSTLILSPPPPSKTRYARLKRNHCN